MVGMLPGVESARRRRFHYRSSSVSFDSSSSSSGHWSTRRSSLCLNNESHHFFTLQRNQISRAAGYEDKKLAEAAREAKERLDEKLNNNALWKSQNKRVSKDCEEQKHLNVFKLKKNSGLLKRLNWTLKWKWKSSEREECVVCLEPFKGGQTLMQLPCTHRFHSRCLMPWLTTNAHCPCCRLLISL